MPEVQPDYIHLDCPRCGAPLQMEGEVLNCPYCRARLILKKAVAMDQNTASNQAAVAASNRFSLKPFSYIEPQSGLEAFTVLVPEGWQVIGGITWVPERPAAPTQVSLQLVNPNGPEAFESFPSLFFNWTNNQMIQMTIPVGSLYFGSEVRPPLPARQAMRQFVLPRYRNIPGLTIVDEGPADELLQVARRNQPAPAQGMQYTLDAVRVRLHYAQNNQSIAEEMSGVTDYARVTVPGVFGFTENIYWSVGYLTSFRASPERLEGHADLYRLIFASIKHNPSFTAFVQQVVQGLTNNTIHHLHQIGDLSRQISRNYNEISEMSMRGWQERSAASDRMAEKFSQAIRGVDAYYDPNRGQNVELPGGYTQAWSTPLGEYILSEDLNFNPNVGSTQTWTPLEPPEQ